MSKGEVVVRICVGGVVALLAVVAIGCGSGGSSTEVALTKAQFIKRGDAICEAAQEKRTKATSAWVKKISKEGKEPEDFSHHELGQVYLTLAVPPVKGASAELGELGAPVGDAQAEKVMESLNGTVESIEEEPLRVFKEAPYEKADKLAAAYGFKSCNLF